MFSPFGGSFYKDWEMKVIVMLLALISCVSQADDLSSMLDENVDQQVGVSEVVFVKPHEWNAALDKIYFECSYLGDDFENSPDIPYIFQCEDWEVRTDSTTESGVTVISIEGIEYLKDRVR